jgi:FG-GAP-like repeat
MRAPAAGLVIAAAAMAATAYGMAGAGFDDFKPARHYEVGASPLGIASGDFNRDGRLDLAVTNFASGETGFSVLKGRKGGRFRVAKTYDLEVQADGIAATRIGKGKDLDLVIGGFTQGIVVLEGAKGVSFGAPELIPDAESPREVTTGDFNRDGRIDIAASRQGSPDDPTVAIYLAQSSGGFAAPALHAGGTGTDILAVPLGRGRKLDLVVVDILDDEVEVFVGRGDGSFKAAKTYPAGDAPRAVAAGRFNRDRYPDLALANLAFNDAGENVVTILRGRANGSFGAPRDFRVGVPGDQPNDVAVADFNRDGRQDLVVSISVEAEVALLRGKRRGRFGPPFYADVIGRPETLLAARFNRDRLRDIAVASSGEDSEPGTVSVLLKKPKKRSKRR